MTDHEITDRLNEIVSGFFELRPNSILGRYSDPFDIRKPNIHDSKAEFLEEKQAVELAFAQATGLFEFLFSSLDEDESISKMPKRVRAAIDAGVAKKFWRAPVDDAMDLVRKNAAEVGATYSILFMLADLRTELFARKQELEDQEKMFWNGKSRPPNHYARTIALRFARLIAKETGKKPTIGTSRDGNHPSTDFGRALEEVFRLLGIKANFRRAGDWAISQLTDDDLKPNPVNALAGLTGLDGGSYVGRNYLAEFAKPRTKDKQQ